VLPVLLLAVAAPQGSSGLHWETVPAPEWDALFDRESGWTGGDGIYSIPLDGTDAPAGFRRTSTLFLFSDTFLGDVNPDGTRAPGTRLVNNTVGLAPPGPPDPSALHFFWGFDAQGEPQAVFVPEVPSAGPGDFYWLKDGIHLNGRTWIFAARFSPQIRRQGVTRIEIPAGDLPPFPNAVQVEVPLALPPANGLGAVVFPSCLMPNTASAGAPFPDGYVYAYGTREDPSKKLLVARVAEADFEDMSAWRFWDGAAWVPDLAAAAPVAQRLSNENSVTPLPDGRFLLVFQRDSLSPRVEAAVADAPTGPWPETRTIYWAPEALGDPDVYPYNAKTHPHLSRPGELLISYNVNTLDFLDHFADADLYRPRFLKLRFR